MKESKKHISLRLDDNIRKKFRYVAQSQGLTASAMMNHMIFKLISEYEKENGMISEKDIAEAGIE